mgnify:CR=1 FL=1
MKRMIKMTLILLLVGMAVVAAVPFLKEKEAENCEKLKELEQLFAGDPETRMKEAARQVEAWKQDYRRMA